MGQDCSRFYTTAVEGMNPGDSGRSTVGYSNLEVCATCDYAGIESCFLCGNPDLIDEDQFAFYCKKDAIKFNTKVSLPLLVGVLVFALCASIFYCR
jgi:hypothetical protein